MFFSKKIEYRKEKRVAKKVAVYYKLDNIRVPWQQARTLNISDHGACILADYRLDKGYVIELEIPHKSLNKREISRVTGQVVWTSPYKRNQFKYGIAFQKKRVSYSRVNNRLRMLADKHCYFLKSYTGDCIGQIAKDLHQIKSAYQMVYNEYVARKICRPHESQMFYTGYSLMPSTRTFLLRKKDQLLGTISLIPDSPAGLPMESIYPDKIQSLRREGRFMAEVGMLALNSECFKKKYYSLRNFRKQAYLFKLFKTMFDYARSAKVTDLIIGVHPKHVSLYEYLNFEAIGPAKIYEGACGRPAVLMRMDIDAIIRNNILLNEGPGLYFLKNVMSAEAFQEHFSWSADTVKEFLLHIKPLWNTLPPHQQSHLKICYPSLKLETQEALI